MEAINSKLVLASPNPRDAINTGYDVLIEQCQTVSATFHTSTTEVHKVFVQFRPVLINGMSSSNGLKHQQKLP